MVPIRILLYKHGSLVLLTHSKILSSEDSSPQEPKKQTVNVMSCHGLNQKGSGLVLGMRNKVTSLKIHNP